jgi:hypothetical protein
MPCCPYASFGVVGLDPMFPCCTGFEPRLNEDEALYEDEAPGEAMKPPAGGGEPMKPPEVGALTKEGSWPPSPRLPWTGSGMEGVPAPTGCICTVFDPTNPGAPAPKSWLAEAGPCWRNPCCCCCWLAFQLFAMANAWQATALQVFLPAWKSPVCRLGPHLNRPQRMTSCV